MRRFLILLSFFPMLVLQAQAEFPGSVFFDEKLNGPVRGLEEWSEDPYGESRRVRLVETRMGLPVLVEESEGYSDKRTMQIRWNRLNKTGRVTLENGSGDLREFRFRYGDSGMEITERLADGRVKREVYDSMGRLTLRSEEIDGQVELQEEVFYLEDQMVEHRFYQSGEPDKRREYSYSEGLLRSVTYSSDSLDSRELYHYDDQNQLVRVDFLDNHDVLQGQELYSYDVGGRKVSYKWVSALSDYWLEERYSYDEREYLTRKEIRESSGKQDGLILYKNDKWGNWVEKRVFEGAGGERLVEVRRREIVYGKGLFDR